MRREFRSITSTYRKLRGPKLENMYIWVDSIIKHGNLKSGDKMFGWSPRRMIMRSTPQKRVEEIISKISEKYSISHNFKSAYFLFSEDLPAYGYR